MCGIVGIFERTGAPADRVAVAAMTRVILHRGPDHSAVFTDHAVGLGLRRLSILDLSPAGNQPMEDESGQFVCVYNGEVYNFSVLRQKLECASTRTHASFEMCMRGVH
jgi:asparagine synthase (glutamine-hydrolysing)